MGAKIENPSLCTVHLLSANVLGLSVCPLNRKDRCRVGRKAYKTGRE